MANEQLIVTCDCGTTSFRVLVCAVEAGGDCVILGASSVPAAGFRDGDFVDLNAGSRAITAAVQAAEKHADVDIAAFYHNIAGSHLHSLWARGQTQFGAAPRAITETDIENVLVKARSIAIPFDTWILATNPVEYAVDRVRGIVDPRGRLGSQLEVEAHLVTGSRSVVRNMERAVEMAGYQVAGRGVDVLAAAAALLGPEERDEGVLLIDIGGRATQWVVFRNGRIGGSGMVPWGGWHLTADLAHGLRIEFEEAEIIKRARGVALRGLVEEAVPDRLFHEERPRETPGLVAAILEPRLEEILSLVKQDVGGPRLIGALGRGIVLTGGGSRCQGSAELAEEVFGQAAAARYLPPRLHGGERLGDGQWATALGLTLFAAEPRQHPAGVVAAAAAEGGTAPIWRRLSGWLGRSSASPRRDGVAASE